MLAADRLITDDYGVRIGLATKIIRVSSGDFYGASGSVSDVARFIEWVTDQSYALGELTESIEAIRIDPLNVALASGKRPVFTYLEAPYYAIGSGAHLALGAMWKGATAEEAVECAIALDISCGGVVDVLRTYEQANQFRPDPAITAPYDGLHPSHFGGPR